MLAKRIVVAVAGVASVIAVVTGLAGAAVPEGARLAFVRMSHDPTRYELATVDPSGKAYRRVLPLPLPKGRRYVGFDSLAWSPDGDMLAFRAASKRPSPISIVSADGSELRQVPGTRGGFLPLFSPDGRTLAFTRFRREPLPRQGHEGRRRLTHLEYESTSVWTIDLPTGERRQLTPWRDGLDHIASSYSPDGSTLLLTRIDERRTDEPEVVSLPAAGGRPKLLIGEGWLPVYSPDGSKIALLRQHLHRVKRERTAIGAVWRLEDDHELYLIDADGSDLRRLTHTPRADELFASWDPSGERLAFVRLHPGNSEQATAGFGDSIMQINADGSCESEILSVPHAALYGPVWQPGPGREASRIDC